MNQLKNFNHPMFGELPVIQIGDKPHFGATAAAKMLGYSNTSDAIARHTKKDGVVFHEVIDSLGRTQSAKFISEGNLYRLITNSKLPNAEQFETWVFDEVLPSIRKHGAYMTPETIEKVLLNPDTIITIAQNLKKEQERRRVAELQLEQQRPKVLFAESVSASETSILIRDLAKLITQNGVPVGEKRLFAWLREKGYLIKKPGSDYNSPTQRSMEMGLFEIKETTINRSHGIQITKTPKVTGRGQIYFINKFLSYANAI